MEKWLRRFIIGKASQPVRNITTFTKKCNQKSMILVAKTRKT